MWTAWRSRVTCEAVASSAGRPGSERNTTRALGLVWMVGCVCRPPGRGGRREKEGREEQRLALHIPCACGYGRWQCLPGQVKDGYIHTSRPSGTPLSPRSSTTTTSSRGGAWRTTPRSCTPSPTWSTSTSRVEETGRRDAPRRARVESRAWHVGRGRGRRRRRRGLGVARRRARWRDGGAERRKDCAGLHARSCRLEALWWWW